MANDASMSENMKSCECGCGQKVRLENNRFIHGHNFKGKHHSEKTRRQVAEKLNGHPVPENTRKQMSISHKDKKIPERQKQKISEALIGNHNALGKYHSQSTKKKMSESHKNLWQNPQYKEKTIKAQLSGLFKRPTSLERQMLAVIQKHNLPYRYTGDGSFLIGYKNPDFVNVNGEKVCIEVRPKNLCILWDKCTPEEYKKKRTAHFAKYGWECLVFFVDTPKDRKNYIIDENEILKKIDELKKGDNNEEQ